MISYKLLSDIIEKPISGEWGTDGNNTMVIRSTNFTNRAVIDFTEVITRNIDSTKISKKRLQRGDIIIEKSGGSPTQPVGRVVYFDTEGEYMCNNFTSILRPINTKVYSKYLLYILFAYHKYRLTGRYQNKTTGIINLQLNRYISEINIPLPPLEEQKKIAAILDAADDYRQKTKALIEKYDQITQSLFFDMFGDVRTNSNGYQIQKLEDSTRFITDGAHYTPKLLEVGYPFMTVANMDTYDFNFKSCKRIGAEDYLSLVKGKCQPEVNDVLFSKDGTVGKVLRVREKHELVILSSIALLRFNNDFNSVFAEYYLKTDHFLFQATTKKSGSAIRRIVLKDLKTTTIPKPPLSLQNEFAEKIAQIECQRQQAEASVVKAEELFNSLLQRAFKGELTN